MAPRSQNSGSESRERQTKPHPSEVQNYGFKDRIGHFTWPNFACTMSTGALAVVLSQQQFKFDGLNIIGKIFFILTLVLTLLFIAAMVARFVLNPWKLGRSLHYPPEALFFGSFWVSIALVLNCMQQYAVPSCGPWMVQTLEVLFWWHAACSLCVVIFQYLTLFVAETLPLSSAMPAWIFPAYPFLVIGPLAAVLVQSQPERAALPMFIGGIVFQGLGWMLAMVMYTIYIGRLMSSELPSPSTRPGMFVSVGPAGYTATCLVALGTQAPAIIPKGFLGLPDFDVGAAVKVIGVLAGIFVWLVAFWFFAVTVTAVLAGVRQMSFTLNWWAFVFPNAGLTLATIQIGKALDSTGIKVVTSGMTILLVIAWFFVAGAHIRAIYNREIYWEGKDEDAGMHRDKALLADVEKRSD